MAHRLVPWLIACTVLLTPALAHAHGRTASHSRWRIDGERASVRLEMTRLDHSALAGATPGEVAARLTLRAGDALCTPVAGSVRALEPSPSWRAYEWELACPAAPTSLRSELLFDSLSAHVHLARVEVAGAPAVERWLSAGEREVDLGLAPASTGLVAMIAVGARHVLGGLDHLVFLLCLIVVARRLREVGLVVTGFTVGHSVTLALAALGLASPEPAAVEALIGLSIALVAIENVDRTDGGRGHAAHVAVAALVVAAAVGGNVPRLALCGCALFAACYVAMTRRTADPARLRVAVALLFGTVHGFGFAAAAPAGELARLAPLVGFNLGVELGQLAVLAAVWPLVMLARRAGAEMVVVRWGSSAAFAAGLMWFLSRN